MRLVTIKQFSNEVLAHLYHNKLSEEGIDCVVSNAISSTLFPIGAGTFSLQVMEKDIEAASKIVLELDELHMAD